MGSLCVSCSVLSDSLQPHGLQPTRLLCPWDSPGQNTGVNCHSLPKQIFSTWGSNPGLLHCRQILYHLSYREALGSLCRTANYQELSSLHVVMYVSMLLSQTIPPSLSLKVSKSLFSMSASPLRPVDRFISTIFLDSIYKHEYIFAFL